MFNLLRNCQIVFRSPTSFFSIWRLSWARGPKPTGEWQQPCVSAWGLLFLSSPGFSSLVACTEDGNNNNTYNSDDLIIIVLLTVTKMWALLGSPCHRWRNLFKNTQPCLKYRVTLPSTPCAALEEPSYTPSLPCPGVQSGEPPAPAPGACLPGSCACLAPARPFHELGCLPGSASASGFSD